jgi:membrane associated rhomboid family serine protease
VGALIMHGLMVLFMGSAVERQWRTLPFLGLWAVVSLGVGLCWALVSSLVAGGTPLAGAGGLVFGLVAAMGVLYRGRRVMFFMATVEMQVLALIVIGIGLLMCIMNPLNLILVLGAPLAYGYVQGIRGIQRRGSDNPGGDFRPGSFVDID